MATYVSLIKYNVEGLKGMKDARKRFDDSRRVIESVGGRILSIYGLLGPYDLLVVLEAPDEKAVFKAMLAIGAEGRHSTETYTAVSSEEFLRIASELS